MFRQNDGIKGHCWFDSVKFGTATNRRAQIDQDVSIWLETRGAALILPCLYAFKVGRRLDLILWNCSLYCNHWRENTRLALLEL
jgi:hypothetical protein